MSTPPATAVAPPSNPRFAVLALVLALASALPLVGAWDAPLLLDDRMGVLENPVVQGDVDPVRILATNSWGSPRWYRHTPNYRPLSVATLAATRAAFGTDPLPYRVPNAAAVALCVVLLLRLCLDLGLGPAPSFLAALLFAVHPAHVEVALFAVNREEAMACAATLLALLLVRPRTGLPGGTPRPWTPGAAAGLLAVVLGGLLSKETGAAAGVLAVLVPLLWPPPPGRARAVAIPALALAVALAVYVPLRLNALGHLGASFVPPQDNPLAALGVADRLAGALAVLWEAVGVLAWPAALTVDYSGATLGVPPGPGDARVLLGGLVLLAAPVAFAVARRRLPVAALGLLAAAVAWAPASHLVFPSSALFGERSLFLPTAGLALALASVLHAAADALPPALRTLRAAGLGLVLALAAAGALRSAARASDHASAISLYAASLAQRPGSGRLHVDLGVALFQEGRGPEAESQFRRALDLDPEDADAWVGLGRVRARAGHGAEAAAHFRRALALRPGFPQALANLCLVMASGPGDAEDALGFCESACRAGMPVDEALAHLQNDGRCTWDGAERAPDGAAKGSSP